MKHIMSIISPLSCIGIMSLYLLIIGCSQEPQKADNYSPSSIEDVVATTTLLATIALDERPHRSSPEAGHNVQSSSRDGSYFHVLFNERGKGVAYIAKIGDALRMVHNGKSGKQYQEINDYKMAISPDGQRIAYGAKRGDTWYMVIDGKEEGPFANIGPPVFSPDSRHIAYEAQIGEKWHIIVDANKSPASVSYYSKPAFSADAKKVFYIENPDGERKMRVVVADLNLTRLNYSNSTGARHLINSKQTMVASVTENDQKKQRVDVFSFDQPEAAKEGAYYDAVDLLAFGSDDVSIAYIGLKGGKRYFIMNDREELIPDGDLLEPPVVRPDLKGLGAIVVLKESCYFYEAFTQHGSRQKKFYDEAANLTYSPDSSLHAYTARKKKKWIIVVNGKEGPEFDRIVMPKFSSDGKYLVYRARKEGKRFVIVADSSGKTIKQNPSYEQVFQPVFTADGKSVAYGVKDGNQLIWKVEKLGE